MSSTPRVAARAALILVTLTLVGCRPPMSSVSAPAPAHHSLLPGPRPAGASRELEALIGEYDTDSGLRLVIEEGGQLWLVDTTRVSGGRVPLGAGTVPGRRRSVGPAAGSGQLRVVPVRPVSDLRAEALAASPPPEPPRARAADLVELVRIDSSFRLEVRYATTNNFLGARFYDEARAFLQRPAAEALVRVNRTLRATGYGLLIHDAYRPWYVTRMFWDATPVETRWLVANPTQGSKHNRGAAVDLTLVDLATGQAVEMPSTYDESTGRAFADYPGGTALQRWHRALLRRAMEREGFIQNPSEWWHYDHESWRDYPIGNVAFNRIRLSY